MKAVFDDRSPNWMPRLEDNVMFMRQQEMYLNDLLKKRGYVTIMDVFNYLGLPVELSRWWNKEFKDLCWVYNDGVKIKFGMRSNSDKNIIHLNFNINID